MKRLVILGMLCLPAVAAAHRPGDSFLRLEVDGTELAGRLNLSLRDLDDAVGIDEDGDRAVTSAELRQRWPAVAAYVVANLHIEGCELSVGAPAVARLSDGTHAALALDGRCHAAPATLVIRDDLVFDIDPQHRALLSLAAGGKVRSAVFRDDARVLSFAVASEPAWRTLTGFVGEGVLHILGGIDHILFLLALLLPALLVRFAVRDILKVVTAFTVAHSLTLALSVLGVVSLPARFIETGIALSVVAAAALNLFSPSRPRWPVAFYLGLLHGFGFSGVLTDLGLCGTDLGLALLGFNGGVELGQAAIILTFVPLAFLLRRGRRVVFLGGSLAVAAVALVWTAQRLVG